MKFWQIAIVLIIAGLAAVVWQREPLALHYFASKVERKPLSARIDLIEASTRVFIPEGNNAAGPYPVFIQFHGCAGARPGFMERWAQIANDAGFAAIIVDSLGPRGHVRETALETICLGKELLGQERAGDVLAAIKIAEADTRLDTDQLILSGWSHGAWTVMDFLTMDLPRDRPAGVADDNLDAPDVDAVVLFYPHCGPGARSKHQAWTRPPETIALVPLADTIVDAQACLSLFTKQKERGYPVELVTYPDTDHAFDDFTLAKDFPELYKKEAGDDAEKRVAEFLKKTVSPELAAIIVHDFLIDRGNLRTGLIQGLSRVDHIMGFGALLSVWRLLGEDRFKFFRRHLRPRQYAVSLYVGRCAHYYDNRKKCVGAIFK